MGLTELQWVLGLLAALLVGFSKTGMPGIGIMVVPLLAAVFGGRPSVGVMLPMLIMGDVFAVAWYRRHTRWDRLWVLMPWVAAGLAAGTVTLVALGARSGAKDAMNPVIGGLVLAMLAVHLARARWGEKVMPHSGPGRAITGTAAGFTTTISNAAGPIMGIYLTSMGFRKEEFMGTTAWYFFIVNTAKLPLFFLVSALTPSSPLITSRSLLFNAAVAPAIVAGVFVGKWALPYVPQRLFDGLVLGLAGIAAVHLVHPLW